MARSSGSLTAFVLSSEELEGSGGNGLHLFDRGDSSTRARDGTFGPGKGNSTVLDTKTTRYLGASKRHENQSNRLTDAWGSAPRKQME
jgi:hypothetical protein